MNKDEIDLLAFSISHSCTSRFWRANILRIAIAAAHELLTSPKCQALRTLAVALAAFWFVIYI